MFLDMKCVIIVCGLPGTGKSALAEALAKELRLVLLSVDPIESAIIRAGVQRSFETGLAAYLVADSLARENLCLGRSVIIDSVSAVPEAKKLWYDLAKDQESKLIIIECICSEETLHQQRIESRVRNMHGIPEVTWEEVQKRRQEYGPWEQPKLILDSKESIEVNTRIAKDYVATA